MSGINKVKDQRIYRDEFFPGPARKQYRQVAAPNFSTIAIIMCQKEPSPITQ
jgi:hypothetical protein